MHELPVGRATIVRVVLAHGRNNDPIAGRQALEARGFELEGSFLGFGHGIGLGWDAPWLIPDDHTPLVHGMVLCVERSVRHNGYYGDFEETVLVTDQGTELLTDAVVRRW